MAENQIADLWDEEDEFDPLAVDDLEINQEDMDDDNPLDTVDYPTMRNMPEDMQRSRCTAPSTRAVPCRPCWLCSITTRRVARCWFPFLVGAKAVA